MPPSYFLSVDEEKACYDHHQNDPADAGYRRFLSRLAQPLVDRLPSGARGLDFGCGPGPTLSVMLEEAGHPTAIYDPFYASDETVWQQTYDFITASEVVEHLHAPAEEFARLWDHLLPAGLLGIMTKRVRDADAFTTWHYKNDPTHVVFFSDATFAWLADHLGARLDIIGPDAVIFQKPS